MAQKSKTGKTNKHQLILGIDIGFGKCGYCLLEKEQTIISAGLIETSAKQDIQSRLIELKKDFEHLNNKFSPTHVVIEKLFFYRKNKEFEKVCMAKGVCLSTFSKSKILEIEPKVLKKLITGSGNSKKKDFRKFYIRKMNINLKNISDDTIDALALAEYGLFVLNNNFSPLARE